MDMTTGAPMAVLLRFALPVFMGNLLQQLYNLADMSIAGHLLGDEALAEIGATSALYSLILMFTVGFTAGLALTVSREFGRKDIRAMKQSVCWMLIFAGMSAACMCVGFLLLRSRLLLLIKTPQEIMKGALAYITVIFVGIPFTVAYNAEASLLRSVGNSTTPLLLLLFSSVFNVCLDLLFMGPLGRGVQGAAIATVLAQGISAAIAFVYIAKSYPDFHFGRSALCVERSFVVRIATTAYSMALMNTIFSIGSVILQSSVNSLGSVYITAQASARKLMELFAMPGDAISVSVATFTGQNHGAGKKKRILKGIKRAGLLYLCWSAVSTIFAFGCAEIAVRLLTGSTDVRVISGAVLYLRCSLPAFPILGFLIIARNALEGMEHKISPLLCSALELGGKILFAFVLVPQKGYGAVCICEPVTWVICAIFIAWGLWLARRDFIEDRLCFAA